MADSVKKASQSQQESLREKKEYAPPSLEVYGFIEELATGSMSPMYELTGGSRTA